MTASLNDKTVLVIGRGGGLARAIAEAAQAAGASVIVAGRRPEKLREAYGEDAGVRVETADLNDDGSITALAERVGNVDHVVSTASARARGKLGELERDADPRQRAAAPDQHVHDRRHAPRRRRRTADMNAAKRADAHLTAHQ
jgi:NAD(P)-dependent dehydrogenase (short-subunit alcohol dehydrogenase family)